MTYKPPKPKWGFAVVQKKNALLHFVKHFHTLLINYDDKMMI